MLLSFDVACFNLPCHVFVSTAKTKAPKSDHGFLEPLHCNDNKNLTKTDKTLQEIHLKCKKIMRSASLVEWAARLPHILRRWLLNRGVLLVPRRLALITLCYFQQRSLTERGA